MHVVCVAFTSNDEVGIHARLEQTVFSLAPETMSAIHNYNLLKVVTSVSRALPAILQVGWLLLSWAIEVAN
jgi:hypothetical protein